MSSTPLEPLKSHEAVAPVLADELVRNRGVIAWSSFFFALLQSICGAIVAINSLRLVIGIGSLVLSTGVGVAMVRFHTDSIRIPMIVIALFGSRYSYACSPSSQPPCRAVAAEAIESPSKANRTRPTRAVSGYTRAYWRRRVPASHFAPLALADHFLAEPRMQTLAEADRQFEDQVVGGQDEDITR